MYIEDKFLVKILDILVLNNVTPILVGGCVRDYFLNKEVKDYDIEIYGLNTLAELEHILKDFGSVNLVGKSFGILKLSTQTMEYDFSFPRLENKIADGHTGFDVIVDGFLPFNIAAKRRDFTINALGYNYKEKKVLDPFKGIEDIEKKVLRYINKDTFIEDPLRIYRAIQMSARFDFVLDTATLDLCKDMIKNSEFITLSKERIFEEYKKLFLKSKQPSIGLKILNNLNLENFTDESMQYIDTLANKKISSKDKLLFIFVCLPKLCTKICNDKKLLKDVTSLLTFQVAPLFIERIKNVDSYVDKIILKYEIQNNMPEPLFMGKNLIEMGYKPNKKFKTILDILYKMQLSGKIC